MIGFGTITLAGGQGYIPTLGVLDTHRRCGIASRILAAMLERTRDVGIGEVVLEVRTRNVAARRLYEKHGFEAMGFRHGYYSDPPDDAVVMGWTGEATQLPRPNPPRFG